MIYHIIICHFRARQHKLRQELEEAARENIQILPEKYGNRTSLLEYFLFWRVSCVAIAIILNL